MRVIMGIQYLHENKFNTITVDAVDAMAPYVARSPAARVLPAIDMIETTNMFFCFHKRIQHVAVVWNNA